MLGALEILIIVCLIFWAFSRVPFLKNRSKKFKAGIIIFFACLVLAQYIQDHKMDRGKTVSSKPAQNAESGNNNENLTHTQSRPFIDLKLEHHQNGDYLYIVNNGLKPAYDIQVLPSVILEQKHIPLLSNTHEKELIGTLFFDDYGPSAKIHIQVYFRDPSSIYYYLEFSVDQTGVRSLSRRNSENPPSEGNN